MGALRAVARARQPVDTHTRAELTRDLAPLADAAPAPVLQHLLAPDSTLPDDVVEGVWGELEGSRSQPALLPVLHLRQAAARSHRAPDALSPGQLDRAAEALYSARPHRAIRAWADDVDSALRRPDSQTTSRIDDVLPLLGLCDRDHQPLHERLSRLFNPLPAHGQDLVRLSFSAWVTLRGVGAGTWPEALVSFSAQAAALR